VATTVRIGAGIGPIRVSIGPLGCFGFLVVGALIAAPIMLVVGIVSHPLEALRYLAIWLALGVGLYVGCRALARRGQPSAEPVTGPYAGAKRGACRANTDTGWYSADCPDNPDGYHVCTGRAGHVEHACRCGHTWPVAVSR
jgi:hypothetical protein